MRWLNKETAKVLCFLLLPLAPANTNAQSLRELSLQINQTEDTTEGLKENSRAHFVFANPKNPQKTPLALLYLHGFSASPKEVSPLAENLARSLKANLYFPRYMGHGIAGAEGFRNVSLEDWEQDTAKALQVGRELGTEIIVIATSTAAPLAIQEAIKNSSQWKALILLSPNFGLPRWDANLLLLPGGKWIARLFVGEYREWKAESPAHEAHWTTRYPSSILPEVVRASALMNSAPLNRFTVPTLTLYCEKDTVIDPKKIPPVVARFASSQKTLEAVPCLENTHLLAGDILSPKSTEDILQRVTKFLHLL